MSFACHPYSFVISCQRMFIRFPSNSALSGAMLRSCRGNFVITSNSNLVRVPLTLVSALLDFVLSFLSFASQFALRCPIFKELVLATRRCALRCENEA